MTDTHGRVTITWPQPNGPALPAWGISVHNADTGEQLLDVTALNLTLGSAGGWHNGPVYVTLTRLLDADDKPIGAGPGSYNRAARTDEHMAWEQGDRAEPFTGQEIRTAEFRYLVAEMRVAPHDPAIPTRESVNRGEHTIDQYREHHGITDAYPEIEADA